MYEDKDIQYMNISYMDILHINILYVNILYIFLVGYVEERLWWPIQSPNIYIHFSVNNII